MIGSGSWLLCSIERMKRPEEREETAGKPESLQAEPEECRKGHNRPCLSEVLFSPPLGHFLLTRNN